MDANSWPRGLPDLFKHSDEDAPIPRWEQVTRIGSSIHKEMSRHVTRIIAGTNDEQIAKEIWRTWPESYRRSVALLIDKITDEGWIDAVGQIKGWPWDGGFYFWPRQSNRGSLARILDSKSVRRAQYIECSIGNGLFAYLSTWRHPEWQRAWMETDAEMAALHVGLFKDGSAEVHLDAYNPLYISGAERGDVVRIPLAGSYNRRLFRLHRRWEHKRYASVTRRSANFYHMMRGAVPLSF